MANEFGCMEQKGISNYCNGICTHAEGVRIVKLNRFNDEHFFSIYEKIPRSVKGLESAGEWHGILAKIVGKSAGV